MIRDLEEELKIIIILWYHFSVNHSVFYGTYFTVPYNIVIITKAPADDQQVLSLAGATRVELVSTVLETAVLPLNYAPSLNARISYLILRTMSREKSKFS